MVKRYELSDAQWRQIEAMLPGKTGDPGRTADNRLFMNGVLWVLRSGARWHELPERYGKWKSVHTPAFRAGPRLASGSASSKLSPKTATTNTHARHDSGSRPSAGCDRKRGTKIRLWGVPDKD